MKKNISPFCSLLLLPLLTPCFILSMENENKKPLIAESVIGTHVPTESHLTLTEQFWYGTSKVASAFINTGEEHTFYSYLLAGQFKPNNTKHTHKLENSIVTFINNKNSSHIIEILIALRRNYPKYEMSSGYGRKIHEFLVKEKKELQNNLKIEIQNKDKNYLAQINDILKLHNPLTQSIEQIQKLNNERLNTTKGFKSEKGDVTKGYITEKCDEIRKVKAGLSLVHQICPTLKLSNTNGYCSDDENDIQNQDHINIAYNDEHILNDIEITQKINDTTDKINMTIVNLTAVISKLNEIKPLEY